MVNTQIGSGGRGGEGRRTCTYAVGGLTFKKLFKIIQTSCSGIVTIRVMRETSNPRNVKLEDPHLDFITAHKGSRGPNGRYLDQTVFSRGVPLKGPKTSAKNQGF